MKTSDLIGPALDWAVAKCEGEKPFKSGIGWIIPSTGTRCGATGYSVAWEQGGPIIEREGIDLTKLCPGTWRAFLVPNWYNGPTLLIAAMRCYVASKLGDEVEVPKELT